MKIVSKCDSLEPCEEAGWRAYDYLLDSPAERDFILRLRVLGSLAYLDKLRQPFFKVQGEYFALKGLQGQASLRVGVHNDFLNELQRVEACIEDTNAYGGLFATGRESK